MKRQRFMHNESNAEMRYFLKCKECQLGAAKPSSHLEITCLFTTHFKCDIGYLKDGLGWATLCEH